MINQYKYGGHQISVKNGKKSIIQIPPAVVLNQTGAFIKVIITHPTIIQENFKQQGKSIPTVSADALIDTGASSTIITPRIVEQLGLIHKNVR